MRALAARIHPTATGAARFKSNPELGPDGL